MKKIYLTSIIVFISTLSCSNFFQKEDKIDSYVEKTFLNCKGDCILDFSNLFDYDNIYIFEVGVTNDEVSKQIGFEYTGDKDISRLILFVKDKQIVYEQNVVFDPDSNPYKVFFDSDKKVFDKAVKFSLRQDKERNVFLLKPIE